MQVYNRLTQFTAAQIYTRRDKYVYTMDMNDTPLPEFIKQIEKDLLEHIYSYLKSDALSGDDAQKLAQQFLTLLPFQDKKDLLDKMHELGKVYKPAEEVYAKYVGPFEEQDRQTKLDAMRKHIQAGNLEAAISVARAKPDSTKGGANANAN